MPIKIFTTIDGNCPFGKGHAIDSQACRKCEYYHRAGTGMFFWCKHPIKQDIKPVVEETVKEVRKRGRPKKSETETPATKPSKRGQTPKKGKERRINVIKQKI